MFKISSEEKSIQLTYLLLFWLATSLVFYFALFHDYSLPEVRSKHLVLAQIEKQNAILKDQNSYVQHIDSLTIMLQQFNPSTSQVYLESSINYELEELRKVFEAKKTDPNYKIFNQLDLFFSMQFYDKKATWISTSNLEFLKRNLEECEIGFQQKQNNLQIQEALNNK